MLNARSILAAKRDGRALKKDELSWIANGLASGEVSDAQAAAFAMTVFLNGMEETERVGLTTAMRDSGDVLSWHLPGPVADKHSTGGIGDCVSLVLAPALAALGAYVPMVSGRGLGHTGGTLDKLDAIPGLKTDQSEENFRKIVEHVGTAIVSATGKIAPADKRLYAIRDVTGLIESIDLITASILSKKLAAGLEALVLDVKTGSGAFASDLTMARALAESLVKTANGAGCRTTALITDMDQPVADCAGNALEIMAVMEALTLGQTESRLCQLTGELGSDLLVTAGISDDVNTAKAMVLDVIRDGTAVEVFGRMITEMGGPADFVTNWRDRLPAAPVVRDIRAGKSGFVAAMDGRAIGMGVVDLGGGRKQLGDALDYSVGLSQISRIGDRVEPDTPLAVVHAASAEDADHMVRHLSTAFDIRDAAVDPASLVIERVG